MRYLGPAGPSRGVIGFGACGGPSFALAAVMSARAGMQSVQSAGRPLPERLENGGGLPHNRGQARASRGGPPDYCKVPPPADGKRWPFRHQLDATTTRIIPLSTASPRMMRGGAC